MSLDLKSLNLFAEFNDQDIADLKKRVHSKILASGEYAFQENEPGESLLIIALGTLRLTKKSKDGETRELTLLGSGSYLGEMTFLDQSPRSATAQAVERSELMVLTFSDLRQFLDTHPTAASTFYKRLAIGIARRLRYMNDDFASLKSFLQHRDIA